jgi:polyisoprenoid-binding protein YceI
MNNRIAKFFGAAALILFGVAIAANWKTDPKQSKLAFVGVQAGAEFEGVFERFNADIRFEPKDLSNSKFDATIDMKSVSTKDKDRDDIIRGKDIFDADRWPSAHYVADKFADKGGGKFSGQGKLTLRDITRDVPIDFTYQTDANGAWLKGSARLKRLDFGAGQGDWKDTSYVSNDVRVEFSLRLNPG